jgi:hypothetical protein
MWGKVKKILVFYDCSRGNAEDQRRSAEYDQAALDALGWPVAKVVLEPGEPKYYYGTNTYDPGFTAWSHYTKVTRDNFYNKIAEMENVES